VSEILSILNFGFILLLYLFLFFVLIVVFKQLKPTEIELVENNKNLQSKYFFKFTAPEEKKNKAIRLTDEMTIGRAAGCSITLHNDNFASSIHARVSCEFIGKNPNILIEDLVSTNGTKVNNKNIHSPTKIKLGDIVQIGDNKLKLVKKK
jgi:uncharacterized protein YpmS